MKYFAKLGLKEIINASGKMTMLGASAVSNEIAQSMKCAVQEYVNMDEIMEYTGSIIAKHTGAEDGCPTIGAASGIVISVAALICGKVGSKIETIPHVTDGRNQIIVQKGHSINFGASINQMITIGGGKVVEVGNANKVESYQIEGAITENTIGLLYVKSHHTVQKGMVSLEEMIGISKKYNIPLICDAAAEEDFKKYIKLGCDVVIYSGGKALEGATSGLIAGKKEIMEACRMQYKGVGRAMKVSKEQMASLITAFETYDEKASTSQLQKERMGTICKMLNKKHGLECSVIQDEAGRDIYRAQIKVLQECKLNAEQISRKLKEGNPSIYLRDYYSNVGILQVDARPLFEGQELIIATTIEKLVSGG